MADLTLVKEMNITDADVQRRLKLVGFGPGDADRVRTFADLITGRAEEFAGAFFDHMSGFEEAAGLFKNPKALETARRMKADHLRGMARGEYGLDYVAERLNLGTLYARCGLDLRVFLGAFHHLMRTIGSAMMQQSKKDPITAFENFMALKKVSFFDLGIITDAVIFERERLIRLQQEAIRELSTPVMQVRDRLLLLPIIGILDTQRAKQLTEELLKAIRAHRAKVVVMDITGVPIVDSKVANHLVQSILAARLMGAATIISGLSAAVAQALVTLGVDVSKLNTVGDLQGGFEEAERLLGYKVHREEPLAPLPDGTR